MSDTSETALPIFIVGDSHVLPYRNMVFRERLTGHWIMARAKYISGFTAGSIFIPESGEFHQQFIQFLEYEGLVRDGRATHLSKSEIDFSIAKASGQPVTPPMLLVVVGDIDIRAAIMPKLADTHDFVPPFETTMPLSDKPLLPWEIIEEAIANRIAPLIAGMRQLAASGFNRLYVQAVVPPTRNETRIRQLHGYACPLSVRSKLVMAYNRKLAEECGKIGVVVLDLWPRLTEGGYLKPDFEVDGVHIPPRAARWHVDELIEHAINSQWNAVNHVRYELYYRMACGLEPFQSNSLTPAAA